MLEILNIAGPLAGVIGALAFILASIRENTARVREASIQTWKDEAEAQKKRADRLVTELEEIKDRLTNLERYNATLIHILSTIDPQKLEELRLQRGL